MVCRRLYFPCSAGCHPHRRPSRSYAESKKGFLVGVPAYAMAVRNSESKQRLTHLWEKILAVA
jgi:hypothetical protein